MKILHTDKDESPALVLDAEQFLSKTAAIASSQTSAPIDIETGNPVAPEMVKKKNNKAIWGIVILLIIAIIATLIIYFKHKQKKDNGNIE